MFAKVNQNMETALFKEKFVDWPDAARVIKVKGTSKDGDSKVLDRWWSVLQTGQIKMCVTNPNCC